MISQATLSAIVRAIHAQPELTGCLIGFQGNGVSRVLHPGFSASDNSERIIVVIEEYESRDPAVLQDNKFWAQSSVGTPENAPNPIVVTNRSRVGPELAGAALTCGMTVVAAVGVFGGAAAEMPTGGASTFLIVASWTGMITQGIECANGLVRIAAIAVDPDTNTLQEWDENSAYTTIMLIVDAVNVASNLASLPAAARNLWAILARQKSFATRGISFAMIKNLNRMERMRLIGEIVADASKTPEGREALIRAIREAGVGAKSIGRTTGLSVRSADTIVRIVSRETITRLHYSLMSVVSNVVGYGISSTPPSATGSASGSLNWIVNVIDGQIATSANRTQET